MSSLQLSLLANALLLIIIIGGLLYYFLRVRPEMRKLTTEQKPKEISQSLVNAIAEARDLMSNDQRLYDRLIDLMEEEKIYRNPELNRDMICKLLNTNHTYLNKAIRLNSDGLSLSDFINSYRVRHAATLLTEQPDLSITEIETQVGFSSRATFYRVFKQHYGKSPHEYRAEK